MQLTFWIPAGVYPERSRRAQGDTIVVKESRLLFYGEASSGILGDDVRVRISLNLFQSSQNLVLNISRQLLEVSDETTRRPKLVFTFFHGKVSS